MKADIVIRNLHKTYPGNIEAVKGISLEIEKGQFFTLLGPNGAGKSTLIKIITTLIRKDSGEFYLGGINPEESFSKVQRLIGVASQENEIDPTEKAENLLIFQGRLFGMSKKQAREKAAEMISIFGLEKEKDKKSGLLSGGNKRRLHCALALIHDPGILFLDEPTVGMDPQARSDFWQTIKSLNQERGVTIFLTTQYLEEADKHATRMALINNGKLHYAGSISGFKQKVSSDDNSSLEDNYLQYLSRFNTKEVLTKNKEEVL